jgi:phospholipase A-2-activating protein
VLENETSDSETLYRASVALGNLLVTPSVAGSLQVGQVQKARSLAVERASTVGEKRLTDLAQEIINLGA